MVSLTPWSDQKGPPWDIPGPIGTWDSWFLLLYSLVHSVFLPAPFGIKFDGILSYIKKELIPNSPLLKQELDGHPSLSRMIV